MKLFYVALAGLLAAFVMNILTVSGFYHSSFLPISGVLHVGMFVVFFPMVLKMRKYTYLYQKGTSLGSFFQLLAKQLPKIYLFGLGMFLAYGFINFLLFMASTGGGNPAFDGEKYYLNNHGAVVKIITYAEYMAYKANEIRGFSGLWMIFYSFSAAFHKMDAILQQKSNSGSI